MIFFIFLNQLYLPCHTNDILCYLISGDQKLPFLHSVKIIINLQYISIKFVVSDKRESRKSLSLLKFSLVSAGLDITLISQPLEESLVTSFDAISMLKGYEVKPYSQRNYSDIFFIHLLSDVFDECLVSI